MAELAWLGIVRHGESIGNVAATRAERGALEKLDLAGRDADVPLSANGEAQAAALGAWLSALPPRQRPEVAVLSSYRRAYQTAEIALAGLDIPAVRDERLRDRELGILDLLTARGVQVRFPEEAERKQRLGKFYYRPPGGESWADVALRLRSLLGDVRGEYAGQRVLCFGHEAVVYLMRYLVERLQEAELMELAVDGALGNASLTSWAPGADGNLSLVDYGRVDFLPAALDGHR